MPISVLIVDDLSFMRELLKNIIEKHNMAIAGEAENGEKALDLYRKSRPDIVLMDITMPVMNGLQALREIKRINPQARVIMCSSLGRQKYVIKAIQLGAVDFVLKPFSCERIVSAISKAVAVNE